jgi:hypothetical protein
MRHRTDIIKHLPDRALFHSSWHLPRDSAPTRAATIFEH